MRKPRIFSIGVCTFLLVTNNLLSAEVDTKLPDRQQEDIVDDGLRTYKSELETEASKNGVLDQLIHRAIEEKVALEEHRGFKDGSKWSDNKPKSKFKYLFFEILTPDEYNDIIYLGEDLLDPLVDKETNEDEPDREVLMVDRPESLVPIQPLNSQKMERYTSRSHLDIQPVFKSEGEGGKNIQASNKKIEVQSKKIKMENLLNRMSERYKARMKNKSELSKRKEEVEKTEKLKSMIDILRNKIESLNTSSVPKSSDKIGTTTVSSVKRATQRTRTTHNSNIDRLANEEKLIEVTLGDSATPSPQEAWLSAMDTLSSKISHMGSGVHRLDLDKILDLDLLPPPHNDNDQKTSNSYTATSAVPPSSYNGQSNKNLPKRQALHPKLTYQRPNFQEVHRPSINIKRLIKPIDEYNPPSNSIKKLPLIPRYSEESSRQTPSGHQCPYIPKRPVHECINAPPDECSSPGYTGNECPLGTICCYDGCINLCWEPPYVSSTISPLIGTSPNTAVTYAPEHVETGSTPNSLNEPLFYSPAPADFKPEIGPNTGHYKPDEEERNYYSTTPPTKHPKGYVLSNTYRSSPKPTYHLTSTKPPTYSYQPPSLEYLPPLENEDIHFHDPHSIQNPIHDAKSLDSKEPSTSYPPPSLQYKEPSIKFVQKPISKGLPELLPYQNYYPPPIYDAPIKAQPEPIIHSYESANLSIMKPPTLHYLPPKKAKSLDHDTTKMQTYAPPDKAYLPPSKTGINMQNYQLPSNDYLPPKGEYMSKMMPPRQEYAAPDVNLQMNTYQVPQKEYLPPKPVLDVSDQAYKPPSKGYLPPQHTGTAQPEIQIAFSPPVKSYLPPQQDGLYTTMKPPVETYSPPTIVSHAPPQSYLPPEKGYIPPANLMLQAVHKGSPKPHAQKNIPTVVSTYAPPSKQYLPPTTPPTYETPKAYVKTDKPSYKGGTPESFLSTTMSVPTKNYIPPVKPETTSYHPEKEEISHTASPLHISTYQPPTKSYLPPVHPTSVPHHVTITYQPKSQAKYKQEDMLHMTPPSKQYKAPYSTCPRIDPLPKEHCSHKVFKCWHPGTPDADCPHNGLCCFDGCYNTCIDPHEHPYKGSYHLPSHSAHIVPSHEYVPTPVVENQHASNIKHEAFHHRTLATGHEHNGHVQKHPASAPVHEMEKVYALGELPVSTVDLKQHYSPPTQSYLPPHPEIPSQKSHYKSTELVSHVNPPSVGYSDKKELPSAYEVVTPVYDSNKHLGPPQKNYFPPTLHSESHQAIKPPSKEYLPPTPRPYEHMQLPIDQYHGSKYEDMKPPTKSYAAPKVKPPYQQRKNFHPPTHEYIPPPKLEALHPKPNYMKPPEKEYLPPHTSGQKYEAPDHIIPPSKEYLPPNYADYHSEVIKPPTKEYLPPEPKVQYSKPDLIMPPNKEYLPPKPIDYKAKTSEIVSPPSKEYVPPATGVYHETPKYMKPPTKEYLPPSLSGPKTGHIVPPNKEYLPPPSPEKHYTTPVEIVHIDGEHIKPPTREYLPPEPKYTAPDHILPPEKEYLPPSSKEHYSGPQSEEYHLPPKIKSYERPSTYNAHELIKPPHKAYLPPTLKDSIHHAVHVDHPSPKPAVLIPPSKEYLPPPQAPHVQIDQLSPLHKTAIHHHEHIKPPDKNYLPPEKHHHAEVIYNHHEQILPPTKEYLPPSKNVLVVKPQVHEHHEHILPPTKNYLPPIESHYEEKEVLIHNHHEGKELLLPLGESKPLPATGVPGLLKHASEPYVSPYSNGHHGLLPHSINIQINIPPSDGKNYKEPTTYEDKKLPIIKEEHDGYISALEKPKVTYKQKTVHHEHPTIEVVKPEYDSHLHKKLPPLLPEYQPSPLGEFKPPHADYLPPTDVHKGSVPPNLLPVHGFPQPHYKPPSKEYLPPHTLDHHAVVSHHATPKLKYEPPSKNYLPPKDRYHSSLHTLQVPSKSYLPPALPDYHHDHQIKPKHPVHASDASISTHYLPPKSEYHAPPGYHPTKIPSHGYKSQGHSVLSNSYLPPSHEHIVVPHTVVEINGHPASLDHHEHIIAEPGVIELQPPDREYLPPPPRGRYKPDVPRTDYHPPSKSYLPPSLDDDYVSPPNRGPQYPVKDAFKINKKKYSKPPDRSSDLVAPDILNSHIFPPDEFVDHYIPPKTEYDVPKNFLRPDEVTVKPRRNEDDDDDVNEEDDVETLDLEVEELPEAFVGLATFKKDEDGVPEAPTVEELDELRLLKGKKSEKLILDPDKIPFPPIPTVPPNPVKFVPLVEKLSPKVLAQLRKANEANSGGKPGFIPGKAGVDYPDFKSIPATEFTCQNFVLPGFYADTFTSCQVFHVCEEGKRQSSFLCPKGTIFNQKYRVCDWWYNVKCEDSTEFFDLNLDLLLLEDEKKANSLLPSLQFDPLLPEVDLGLASISDNSLLSQKQLAGLISDIEGLTGKLDRVHSVP